MRDFINGDKFKSGPYSPNAVPSEFEHTMNPRDNNHSLYNESTDILNINKQSQSILDQKMDSFRKNMENKVLRGNKF